jgi:hypothetical protein
LGGIIQLTRRTGRSTPLKRWIVIYVAVAAGFFLASAAVVMAARIGGRLAPYEGNSAQGGRYLHLENTVTGDSYLMRTGPDGLFVTHLPPGVYNLRAEYGAILVHAIVVGPGARIALGQVSELAPYTPVRIWQYQAIASSLLVSSAPSAANILTSDTRELPPGRPVMEAPPPLSTSATRALPRPAVAVVAPPPGEAPNLQPQTSTRVPSGQAPSGITGQPPPGAGTPLPPAGASAGPQY